MLAKRVATAVVLFGFFLLSLFSPWNFFPVFVTALLTVAAWEWASLANIQSQLERIVYVGGVVALLVIMAAFQQQLLPLAFKISLVVFWFWIFLIPLLFKFPETETLFRKKPFAIAISILILVSAAGGLLWLRLQENGAWLVLMLIVIVTIADSGAYFAGKKYGKTPLAPNISPGKTLEGLYGGLVANFVFALVLCFAINLSPEKSFALMAVVLGTSLFSVEGDLLESVIKRSQGVKDSGTILPGHGGVLDRIDGLCAATTCFVFGILLTGI